MSTERSLTTSLRAVPLPFFMGLMAFFFLISGAAGLIYQVAWVRMLSLVFGVTIHAVSAVLSGFMLGLALGSFLGGRWSTRFRSPLAAYGWIEIAIAVVGIATPFAFGALAAAYPTIYRLFSDGQGVVSAALGPADAVRLLLAFVILLIPTTLMGMTLPIILRSALARGISMGNGVALLYAINTTGAIVGTVSAGFFIIADFGLEGAIRAAALCNVVAGIGAVLLAWYMRERLPKPGEEQPAS